MVALGLILLVLSVALAAGVALSNTDSISAEAFGVSVSDLTVGGLFLLGAAVGALALLGLGLMLRGAARKRANKRALKREVQYVRTEQESLAEENARLQAELEQERTAPAYPSGGPMGPQSMPSSTVDVEERGKHRR